MSDTRSKRRARLRNAGVEVPDIILPFTQDHSDILTRLGITWGIYVITPESAEVQMDLVVELYGNEIADAYRQYLMQLGCESYIRAHFYTDENDMVLGRKPASEVPEEYR